MNKSFTITDKKHNLFTETSNTMIPETVLEK